MRMKSWRLRNRHLAAAVGLALSGAASLAHAHASPPPPPPPGRGPGAEAPRPPRFHEVIARMSPAGREIMAEAVRKGAPEKQNWEALKQTREEILRLIAQPSLDTGALEGAFVRERKLSLKLQAGRHEALLKAAGRLSPEDRQIFAEGLRATRLHIPGETIKQIQKAKDRCRDEKDGKKAR